MSQTLQNYISDISKNIPLSPALVDEKTLISIMNSLFHEDIQNLEMLKKQSHHNIFFYGIPDDKTELTVSVVRDFLSQIALKPYSGHHIFIIENFESANENAQNAMLKIIEEPPEYARIFLVVTSISTILETILSRTVNFFNAVSNDSVALDVQNMIFDFLLGDRMDFVAYLHANDFDRDTAIKILSLVLPRLSFESQNRLKKYLEALLTTNEKPKNILEAFFLSE